eukprot:Polyplicarium_translucidae@DN4183_c0_g1_i1.p2
MKFAKVALFAAAAMAEQAGQLPSLLVGPAVMCPGFVGNCGEAVPQLTPECGSKENPCFASAKAGSDYDVCGECYLLEYESGGPSGDCSEGSCPTMRKEVHVQIQDHHTYGDALIMVGAANGFHHLCPVLCFGQDQMCQEEVNMCAHGDLAQMPYKCTENTDEVLMLPGSFHASPQVMTIAKC